MDDDIHSRSRLAGYKPEILFNSSILIVGCGALGQNLALNLALAGIGEIHLVDFDVFEAHNATRSPLYPTREEQALWGNQKAKIVAHKLYPLMTAPSPTIRYATVPIQSLGDLPIIHAQLIFAAVDNQHARAYLAERCRIVGRPLIEAGFYAELLNLAVFGPDADEPCYRCLSPEKEGAYSCTRYALSAQAQQILPAIQNTAAVLAGLQAEVGIQWLHGERSLRSTRVYSNIRVMTMNKAQLMQSPSCPGIHWQHNDPPFTVLPVRGSDSLRHLLKMVEQEIGSAQVRLPEDLVVRNFCIHCQRLVEVCVPEWSWVALPQCVNCDGLFKLAAKNRQVSNKVWIYTREDEEHILNLPCAQVGLASGTLCEIWPETKRSELGQRYLMQMQGTIDELMEEISCQ